MKKISIEQLRLEVINMKIGETIVVSSNENEDIGLVTTISKIDFLGSDMLLMGGYNAPIKSYEIFDNLPEETEETIIECVNDVFSFLQDDEECLNEVILERRGKNSLSFTV